ncbi:hypothetical protein D3C80_1277090 [compost metagenome]
MRHQQANRLHQCHHLYSPLLQRLVPSKAEQLLGHLRAALTGIENVLKQALAALRIFTVKGQPRRADDDGQQVIEVMGHATGQLAEGFELLCLKQLRAHRIKLQGGLATVGDVTGDLRQTDNFAIR